MQPIRVSEEAGLLSDTPYTLDPMHTPVGDGVFFGLSETFIYLLTIAASVIALLELFDVVQFHILFHPIGSGVLWLCIGLSCLSLLWSPPGILHTHSYITNVWGADIDSHTFAASAAEQERRWRGVGFASAFMFLSITTLSFIIAAERELGGLDPRHDAADATSPSGIKWTARFQATLLVYLVGLSVMLVSRARYVPWLWGCASWQQVGFAKVRPVQPIYRKYQLQVETQVPIPAVVYTGRAMNIKKSGGSYLS